MRYFIRLKWASILLLSVLSTRLCAQGPYDVTWTDVNGAIVSGDTITKTAASGWGNAGAVSQNQLLPYENGWIEYEVTGLSTIFALGFSDTNTNDEFYTIDYSFQFTEGSLTYVRLNGGSRLTFHIAVGDILRIERSGGNMLFKRNGNVIYTAENVLTSSLMVDLTIHTNGGVLQGIQTSFGDEPGMEIEWTELVGVSVSGNTITKTAANGYGNAGAISQNVLEENTDGWIQFTYDVTGQERVFGFSDANVDNDYNTIDFAFLTNFGLAFVYINGENKITLSNMTPGDVLRIERVTNGNETTMYWKRNNSIVYAATTVYKGGLQVDAAIGTNGASILNARCSFPVSLNGVMPTQQYLGLRQFYDSLNGTNWTNQYNWPPQGNWPLGVYGAAMDTVSGHVLSMIMENNNVAGVIPSAFWDLTHLWMIRLDNNAITSVGSIQSANYVYEIQLNHNQLTSLPEEFGSMLPNLQILRLSHNNLMEIPSSLGYIETLTELNLSNNNLKTLPDFVINHGYYTLDPSIYVSNNYLDFSSLEPLVANWGVDDVTYLPQKRINDISEVHVVAGDSLVIPSRAPGQHSTIAWQKLQPDSTWLNVNNLNEDLTQATFSRHVASSSDDGVYRWQMTNSLVTGLTLESEPIVVTTEASPANRRFLMDFGNPSLQTSLPGWNNITSVANGTVVDLTDSEGNPTTVSFETIVEPSNGYGGGADHNSEGYNGAVLDYPASACQDSHYAYTSGGTYRFNGLDNSKVYQLRIFAARHNVSDARTGTYTINGLQLTLDAANNTTETILFSNLVPVNGAITIDFGVGAGSSFGYINVMDLEEGATPTLNAPGDLVVQLNDLTGELSWTDNASNETGYSIERRISGYPTFEEIARVGADTTTFIDASITSGFTYEYRVKALQGELASGYSAITTLAFPNPPGQRRFLIDLGSSASQTLLPGWNNLTVATTGSAAQNLVDSENTSSSIGFVVSQQGYHDYLNGVNTDGGYAGAALGYPQSACIDGFFSRLSGGYLKLTGLDPAKYYSITLFGSRAAGDATRKTTFTLNDRQYVLDAANNSAQVVTFHHVKPESNGEISFHFGVQDGSSFGYLNVVDITERVTPTIQAPSNLQAEVNGLSVTLTWDDNASNETGFIIERRILTDTPTLFTEVGQVQAGVVTYTGEMPVENVEYRVSSFNENAYSHYSNAVYAEHAEEIEYGELSLALKDLYDSLGGANWTTKTNWPSSANWPAEVTRQELNAWHGLYDQGFLFIQLGSNNLTGKVPASLWTIDNMASVLLYDNQITGVSFGDYTGNVDNLYELDLSINQLSSLPEEISMLHGLQHLGLYQNNLTYLPESIGELEHLFVLWADHNNLTELPVSLTELTYLTDLDVSDNYLDFASLEPFASLPFFTYAPQKKINDYTRFVVRAGEVLSIPSRNPGEHSAIVWEKMQPDSSWININHLNEDPVPFFFTRNVASVADEGLYRWRMTNSLLPDLTLESEPIRVYIDKGIIPDYIEFQILKDLYDSLGGEQWTNKTGWPAPDEWGFGAISQEFNNWYGITVDSGDITAIDLSNNNLSGTIPSSIGGLSELRYFDLGLNEVSGQIPATIGDLHKMETINFSGNNLSGSIPPSIGNLTEIRFLVLSHNLFSGSIPSTIGSLSKLVSLSLEMNLLSGEIPSTIGGLDSLQSLGLRHNDLSGAIPATIGDLASLTSLNLGYNQLTGSIPASVGNLSRLIYLDFGHNQLSGAVPVELGNLTSLEGLDLFTNQLQGSISFLSTLSSLRFFNLDDNQFSGPIPSTLGSTGVLLSVHLNNNQLTGTLPQSLANSTDLFVVRIYNNQLSGSLPASWGNLTSLQSLDLHGNQLSGTLPPELGNMTSLVTFEVYGNQFTGAVPDEVLNLTQLRTLNLSANNFTGLPDLATHPNKSLLTLYFINNRLDFEDLEKLFTGPGVHPFENLYYNSQQSVTDIPSVSAIPGNLLIIPSRNPGTSSTIVWEKREPVGTVWTDVSSLNEDPTQVTFTKSNVTESDFGEYRWRMTNTTVTGLTLTSPTITVTQEIGTIPDYLEFQALKNLYDSLGGEGWTNKSGWPTPGNWPATATSAQFGTWRGISVVNGDIQVIDLRSNNLIGQLPSTLSNARRLRGLFLNENQITGEIPDSYRQITSMRNLQLFNNRLSGNIPPWIGELTNLQILYLGRNDFSGPIPESIGNLSELYWLSFHYTNISGEIPDTLYNLTKLTDLYIYYTQVSGGLSEKIGKLTKLKNLWMYSNNLSGALPVSLGNIATLENVYLHRNKFSGSIPANWQNLINLKELSLYYNQLDGDIPEWISTLNNLTLLSIGSTNLHGAPPASYSNLTNLTGLYLEHLGMEGPVPPEWDNLDKLTVVDIKYNNFTGAVPDWLMNQSTMKNFILNHNKFDHLPDFSARTDKAELTINIEANRIPFADIERYFTGPGIHPFNTFTYEQQQLNTAPQEINVPVNSQLRIEAPHGGAHGVYTWEKQAGANWIDVAGLNESSEPNIFIINNVTTDVSGTYRYTVSNSWATGLVVESGPILVEINEAVSDGSVRELYNGIITSIAWRGEKVYSQDEDHTGMYLFNYDNKYQITEANFATPDFATNTFIVEDNRFRLTGMRYDPNGNIEALKRFNDKGKRVHNFAYEYKNSLATGLNLNEQQTNKLTAVAGYVDMYEYNAIGQVTEVHKTGNNSSPEHADQFVEYDVTGKVRKVYAAKNESTGAFEQLVMENLYDDRGFRLAKKSYSIDNGVSVLKETTWYIRDASGNIISTYKENPVENVVTQVEVPVYGSGKIGTYYPHQDGSMEYEVTDHLGNVRALLRDDRVVYQATMEDTGLEDITNPRVQEMQYFENLFETAFDYEYTNHTQPSEAVPEPDKSAYLYWTDTPGETAAEKAIGPAIALKVNQGDELTLETWVRFEEKESYTGFDLATLASLVGGTYSYMQGFESFSLLETSESLLGAFQLAAYPDDGDNTLPHAFLNYVVYDKHMAVVDASWKRVSEAAGFEPGTAMINPSHEHLAFDEPVKIQHDGYIYVWVSNESQATKVWFDDLTVTHVKREVVQATDYGAWGDVIREQRAGELSWAAQPETCVPCSELSNVVTTYVTQNGTAALQDEGQLQAHLNYYFGFSRSIEECRAAIDECRILESYLQLGGSAYVDFGQHAHHQMGTDDFTLEAWIKVPSSIGTGKYPIVSNLSYTGTGQEFTGFSLHIVNKQLYFVVGDGADYAAIRATSLPSYDEWHQVVVQRIGHDANTFTMYIDGEQLVTTRIQTVRNALTGGNTTSTEPLLVGSAWDDTYFTGAIRQVKLFRHVFTWDEIGHAYNSGCTMTPGNLEGLVLWAPLDDGGGTAVYDRSSFGTAGGLTGSQYTWTRELKQNYCVRTDSEVLCTSSYYKKSNYRFGYQGQFAEKDDETGWNHFELREYDPVIGRWNSVDPMDQFPSPYLSMGNNPIIKIDPDGGCVPNCPPPKPSFLRSISSSTATNGITNWKVSVGIGAGWRSKSFTASGTGLNGGVDYAHGLVYFGSESIGFQGSVVVLALNGDYKGENYYGGEFVMFREYLEYNFESGGIEGDYNFGQYKWREPIWGTSGQSENNYDKTPSTNIDAIEFEAGFETNFFKVWTDAVKQYVQDLISPAMLNYDH